MKHVLEWKHNVYKKVNQNGCDRKGWISVNQKLYTQEFEEALKECDIKNLKEIGLSDGKVWADNVIFDIPYLISPIFHYLRIDPFVMQTPKKDFKK